MPTLHADGSQSTEQIYLEHCAKAASVLSGLGYRLIPLRGKLPQDSGWQTLEYPPFMLEQRILDGCNFGAVFGQIVGPDRMMCALDVDIDDVDLANAVHAACGLVAPLRFGRYPKYLMPVVLPISQAGSKDFGFWLGDKRIAIQVLGRGQRAPAGPKQAAFYGIHPTTGKPYRWDKDAQGRNVFQMRPQDWPFVSDLDAMMARVAEALAKHGWTTRATHARNMGAAEAAYAGPITERQIAADKALLDRALADLSQMPVRSGRGDKCHTLGLQLGVVIRAGYIDLEQTLDRLREAMPDNHNAPREFERGVMASTGERQRTIFESQNVDWTAKAAQEGLKPEDFMGPPAPPPPKDEEAAEAAQAASDEAQQKERCDTYRIPLINGACDIMHDAQMKRTAEETRLDEDIARGFMCSLLAAGMSTIKELAVEWQQRAGKLTGKNLPRYGADALRIAAEILKLQPTESAWARYAAKLMATKGLTPCKAIRAAQLAHKAEAHSRKAKRGTVEADILAMMGNMVDWDRDPNNEAEGGSYSNLKFFMAGKLFVWPYHDEFTETMAFRRLIPKGHGRDEVSDDTLDRWTRDPASAVVDIYAMSRDRTAPWGPDNWSPRQADIQVWLQAMVGDDKRQRFNSLVDRMAGWEAWDGQERLGDWLARYVECLPWEPAYDHVCAVGAHFMRNWAHRMENPGHKWDELLVLVGLQGERKTTMFELLADCVAPGGYLAGQRFDYDGKTGINRLAEAMRGKVLGEMAELTSLGRRDMENFKAMVSNTVDSGRRTFGLTTVDKRRQFGFVGTANCSLPHMDSGEIMEAILAAPENARARAKREFMAQAEVGFLTDHTGSRRFHPVLVNAVKIDLESLALEASQLIAEARAQVALDRSRLHMNLELQALAEKSAGRFQSTDGLDDVIRVKVLLPMEGAEHYKIALADLRRVLGLNEAYANGQGARKLKTALQRCGLVSRMSNGMRFALKGDYYKAERVAILEGGNTPKLAPPAFKV